MCKGLVVGLIISVAILGCYCKRCNGQEAPKVDAIEEAKPVVLNSTEVVQWKKDLFDGLNQIKQNPYDTVADLLLMNGFGLTSIPRGRDTVEVTATNYDKMQRVIRSIKAVLGFALIQQATVLQANHEAVQAAIESATDTITDVKQREAFLKKAQLLNKE